MRTRLLAALLSALLSAGVPAAPAASPGASPAAAPPPGTHEPELVEDDPAPWKWIAAGGALLLAAGIALQMARSRARREQEDVREARDSFMNPVKVIRFHRDPAPKDTDAGGLRAVTKTVDAVMEAEQKAQGAGADVMASLAASVAGQISANAEKAAEVSASERAQRDMLESQLALARDFSARGLQALSRDLASMIAKDKEAPADIREKASEFARTLPPGQDARHADRARG